MSEASDSMSVCDMCGGDHASDTNDEDQLLACRDSLWNQREEARVDLAKVTAERNAEQAAAMIFEAYAKAHQRERMRENARANEAEDRVAELEESPLEHLTEKQRVAVLSMYCAGCGGPSGCQCINDE